MNEAQKATDIIRYRLAKGFLTVYIANQMGVTYRTAEKYADGEVGEFWLVLADIAIKSVNEMMDDTYGKYLPAEVKLVTDSEN